MRELLLSVALLACSNNNITAEPDAQATKDGAAPDSSSIDGGEAGPNPGWSSGTRLRARVVSGSDGAKNFVGWYDSMRKENCSFRLTSEGNGTLRCLPDPPPGAVYYLGPVCDGAPMLAVGKGCTTPTTMLEPLNPYACPEASYRVRSTSGPVGAGNLYVKMPDGSCAMVSAQVIQASYDLYNTGAEIAPALFVDGTIKAE